MDDDQEAHDNIGLGLGLSVGGYYSRHAPRKYRQEPPFLGLDLSFSPHPKDEPISADYYKPDGSRSSPRTTDDDEAEVTTGNNGSHNDNTSRKKLRLTKEQSSLLENSFKLHTTLNPAQKQTLAEQLNLKPRQVEVWFQNRRARTKLKQTEVDCEFLKRCCEGLSDENRRLKKQLQELKADPSPPLYLQKAATLTMCPSCERVRGGAQSEDRSEPEDQ